MNLAEIYHDSPLKSLSLYMEALDSLLKVMHLGATKEDVPSQVCEEANVLFQKCCIKAEEISNCVTTNKDLIPSSGNIIFQHAKELGINAEIDCVFGDKNLALDGYTTALNLLFHINRRKQYLKIEDEGNVIYYIRKFTNAKAKLVRNKV